ncbi:MAG: DNA repair protein RadA [Ruminococcaceae bacterium]|nr:DNA repair protein RadA [Oscillospiraceae bacterium]
MKSKSVFFCTECGYESSGWLGKCPGCQSWNTFAEEKIKNDKKSSGGNSFGFTGVHEQPKAATLSNITSETAEREATGIGELDRVLGGGIVKGSLILAAGDPGIGKSTMMLMLSGNMAKSKNVLYVSGEESAQQIKMRAQRLHISAENLYIYSETIISNIEDEIERIKPDYIVIDSVQTVYDEEISSAPGSVSQVREITCRLMKIAKGMNVSVFIIGHVTKDGGIAGPRVLEHMVDTVLYFEGERQQSYRILRCVKNRFGSTNEIGVFEMREDGLAEVKNPSLAMLEGRPTNAAGTAVVCTLEGTRPMLLEVQALVSNTTLSNPRRMATGLDYNRVSLLIAVLEKRAGYKMCDCDAYVNVIGGMRIYETAADAAIAAAIMSSYRNKIFPEDTVIFGEIGLTGEIRSVSQAEKRVKEAFRMGFEKCIVPKGNEDSLRKNLDKEDIKKISFISSINEIFE